jgi:geranylgeranylglycerol-phosphate geranylgeranyltransferase
MKSTGLPGNMMVSTAAAGTFIFGGAVVGEPFKNILLTFSIMAFLFTLAGEIAGDAMDIEGDKKRNAKTLAITIGKINSLKISSTLIIGFVLISFIPYIMGWLGQIFLILIIIANSILLYLVKGLIKSNTSEEGRMKIRHLYYVISLVLISFITGIIQI